MKKYIYDPPFDLLDIVDKFYIIEKFEDGGSDVLQKFPPFPHPVLMIHCGKKTGRYVFSDVFMDCSSVLSGILTYFPLIDPFPETEIIGVHFTPEGLYRLLGVEMSKLKDVMTDGSTYFFEISDIISALQEEKDHSAKLETVVSFIRSKNKDKKVPEVFRTLLRNLNQEKVFLSVNELAQKYDVSKKTIERYFLKFAGITPKTYLMTLRLNKVFEYIYSSPESSMNEAITKCGYFDQAHFIKDFKKISGETPLSFFRNKSNTLAKVVYDLKD